MSHRWHFNEVASVSKAWMSFLEGSRDWKISRTWLPTRQSQTITLIRATEDVSCNIEWRIQRRDPPKWQAAPSSVGELESFSDPSRCKIAGLADHIAGRDSWTKRCCLEPTSYLVVPPPSPLGSSPMFPSTVFHPYPLFLSRPWTTSDWHQDLTTTRLATYLELVATGAVSYAYCKCWFYEVCSLSWDVRWG